MYILILVGDTTIRQNGGEVDGENPLNIDLKHLYNSSDVMYIDESDTGTRGRSPGESIATIDVFMEKRPARRTGPDTCSLAVATPTELDTLIRPQVTAEIIVELNQDETSVGGSRKNS